jgi:hypothetical protein
LLFANQNTARLGAHQTTVNGRLSKQALVTLNYDTRFRALTIMARVPVDLSSWTESLFSINSLSPDFTGHVTSPTAGTLTLFQEGISFGCSWLPLLVGQLKHVGSQAAVVDILVTHFLETVKATVLLIRVHRLGASLGHFRFSCLRGVMLGLGSRNFGFRNICLPSVLHLGQVIGHLDKIFVKKFSTDLHRVDSHFN